LEVDLHVPDHLKPTFAEMSPIFKNVEVSRDDIGDHMRQYDATIPSLLYSSLKSPGVIMGKPVVLH
jgi:hypothetical protein